MPIAAFDQSIYTYGMARLEPAIDDGSAKVVPVNLAPNTNFVKGTVLGQVGTVAANDVQTLTIGGTPTGGTFIITATHPISGATVTITPNYNSTVVQTQALVTAAFGSATLCVVSGGTLPGATQIFTFGGNAAGMPVPVMTAATTGLTGGTPTAAVVHTTVGASPGTYAAYNDGLSDGTQVARGILQYDCSTDAAGNITNSPTSSTGGFWGEKEGLAQMYISGIFNASALTGLDANGLADLQGKYISGATTGTYALVKF